MGIDPQFADLMNQMQAIIAQAQAAQGQQRVPGLPMTLPPRLQQQFDAKVFRAHREMHDFDRLSKERLDTSVAGMLGDASAAGIDVSSWKLR